ncbi:MAG: DUF1554 domain-containing protein [Bacteriovoracaceae bacterium]|jgi:hypothetical protein|nr:DUF1554 domain-containing protein [Bacteriovoracaceae bacterium]
MAKEVKKQIFLLRLFFLSFMTFFLNSCNEDIDIAQNEASGQTGGSGSGSSSCSTSDHCKIFVTNSTYSGNLGGTAGADTKCQTDVNKPAGSSTYKALISSSTRSAKPVASDWVLYASTEYRRPDGTVIGTTQADRTFSSPMTNSWNGSGVTIWSGISLAWATNPQTCSNWTDGSGVAYGTTGRGDYSDHQAWDYGASYFCNYNHYIVCVEQ